MSCMSCGLHCASCDDMTSVLCALCRYGVSVSRVTGAVCYVTHGPNQDITYRMCCTMCACRVYSQSESIAHEGMGGNGAKAASCGVHMSRL